MNIKSGARYPAGALSNFSPYTFTVDGVLCNSMEGFLQSLKFSSIEMQKYVCTLVGKCAKSKGARKNWKRTQTLYWLGVAMKRDSDEYQALLDKAFYSLCQNGKFRKALLATQTSTIKHSIGRRKITDTVLTQQEFCSRLTNLRGDIKND